MGIVAIGFALWSLYDGVFKYPQQRERALALQKLMEEKRLDEWDAYARERGWPTTDPGEPKGEGDIIMQFVMAAVAGAVGGWLLLGVWLSRGRWIESTESGIITSWGQTLDFDQVAAVNKRRWKSKGIAKVTYQVNGRNRRFTIDDYKFDRHPTGQILRELEAQIDPDLITGGPPEMFTEAADSEATEVAENSSNLSA